MSTTIDSLAIEIQSNSSGAISSIERVASALEKIKKGTVTSGSVKNLKELTTALKGLTPVSSNAQKLGSLADSLSRLAAVKSLRGLTNQLKELPNAMRGLSGLDVSGIAPQIERIANAIAPLGNIKAGGLSSIMNSLKKLDDVTNSLNDGAIDRFVTQVKKLDDELGPLSVRMYAIGGAFKAANTSARTAGSGFQHFGNKVNTTTLNLASLTTVIQGVISVMRPIVRLLSDTISDAIEWDGISQRFGRGFGENASEVYAWVKRLNEELGINVQQFMQYSSTYATMLKGFGVGSKDASNMALGYMELTYDIWAGYNDIYKSMDDAAAAVRSAIAGEVEPVRKAGFTIIESTLEQTAANHGLQISLENATEAQKSYLRYLTLVDQAHAQGLVGTYAKELTTAEGMMRTFSQQLKSLAQTFGSVFLPILVKIMPWLSAFVELLGEGIIYMAGLFGIEIQKVDFSGYGSGLGDISDAADGATDSLKDATEAAKELKNASIGIDELNVISPQSKSGGAGGAGGAGGGLGAFEGMDVDSLWDESIFDQVKSQVDEIKEKIKGFFDEWETEIKLIGGLLAALGMAKMLEHLGQALNLGDKFLGVIKTISKLAVSGIVIVLQYTLVAEFFDKFIDGEGFKNYVAGLFVSAIGTGILYSMWGPAGLVIGLGVTAAASLKAIIDNGGVDSVESATVALTGFAAAVGAVATAWKLMTPVIDGIKEYVAAVKLMAPTEGVFVAMFPKLSGYVASLSGAFSGAISTIGTFLAGISAPVWAGIAAAIAAVIGVIVFLVESWDEVTAATKRFFDENIVPKLDAIKESFGKMREALGPIGDAIAAAWEWIKKLIEQIDLMEGIKDVFWALGFVVVDVIGGQLAGCFNQAMSFIEGFIQVFTGIVEIVSGVVRAVVKLCSGDLNGAWDAVKLIGQGIADVFVGLYDMTIGGLIEWVEGIIDWCVYLWDELVGHSIIPDTIDGIVECFKSLPGRALGFVTNFVTDTINKFKDFGSKIVEKVSSGWNTVKSWWTGKSGLEKAEVAVSLVKKGWSTVKSWIGSIPGVSQAVGLAKSGWSTVKKWVGSIPSVSQAVKLAKSGWSSVKSWVGSMPKLSAGIKLVKSGWSSVKSWLGNLNFNLGFKLPKIKVNWGSKTVAGFTISYPTGFSTYAKGGFPDIGEMFIAREAGPELVGRIGSKTTVANNDQIVDGISEGVYAAVLAAMRASERDGTQSVNVYLDGRQITSSVEKRQRERGASIMGSQVYAY